MDDAARDESLVSHAGFFARDSHVRNGWKADASLPARAVVLHEVGNPVAVDSERQCQCEVANQLVVAQKVFARLTAKLNHTNLTVAVIAAHSTFRDIDDHGATTHTARVAAIAQIAIKVRNAVPSLRRDCDIGDNEFNHRKRSDSREATIPLCPRLGQRFRRIDQTPYWPHRIERPIARSRSHRVRPEWRTS